MTAYNSWLMVSLSGADVRLAADTVADFVAISATALRKPSSCHLPLAIFLFFWGGRNCLLLEDKFFAQYEGYHCMVWYDVGKQAAGRPGPGLILVFALLRTPFA